MRVLASDMCLEPSQTSLMEFFNKKNLRVFGHFSRSIRYLLVSGDPNFHVNCIYIEI